MIKFAHKIWAEVYKSLTRQNFNKYENRIKFSLKQ